MKHNIALIGPMASGKTTVGKCLSQLLHYPVIDCDQTIEQQANMSVSDIFAQHGEAYFRLLESKTIEDLSNRPNIIIATGGGVVKALQNREILKAHSYVVYLQVTIADQLKRTTGDTTRPLLNVPDREQRLMQLQAEREPLYRSIADLYIDTGQFNPQAIAEIIMQSYCKNQS